MVSGFGLGEHTGFGGQIIEVDVGLCGAVVVGVAGGGVVAAHAPVETVGPIVGVVVVTVVGVDRMESHQAFEVDGAGPDVGLVDFLARVVGDSEQRIGMFFEIVVVDLYEGLEGLFAGRKLFGRHAGESEQDCKCDDDGFLHGIAVIGLLLFNC